MSSRVILVSVTLTALLAGVAIYFLVQEDGGAIGTTHGRTGGSSVANSGNDSGESGGAETSGTSSDLVDRGRGGNGRVTTRGGANSSGGSSTDRNGNSKAPRLGPGGFPIDGIGTNRDGDRDPGTLTSGAGGSSSTNRTRGGTTGSNSRGSDREGTRIDGVDGNGTASADRVTLGENVSVAGTIIAINAVGEQFPEESGTLEIRITGPGLDELREVVVAGGNWSTGAPERAQLRFTGATLGDRRAVVSPTTPVTVSEGANFNLIGEWTSETLLHVRSRETGEVLCDLTLLRVPDWMRNSRPHPGAPIPTDQQWSAECSPIPLSAEGVNAGASVPYHVHSPGYAWGRILLDTSTGGDREILLDAGGDLDLTFEGGWDHPGAVLRLRELGATQPYAEVPVSAPALRVNGILPGDYEVAVETGSWAQSPLVLGSIEVTVIAGEITPHLLLVDTVEDEERVPFGGTVFVPTEWLLDEFQLRIRPIDPGRNVAEETQHVPSLEMTATEIAGGILYGWEADPVEPGNFGLLVLPIGYGINVAVSEAGNLQAEIALPPPVPVEVHTVIAGTEEPATPNVIRWTPAREAGVPGSGALSVTTDPGSNIFIFDAPIGGVILSSSDSAYRPASRQITLSASGPNVFTFELEPAHGVSLSLFDEDTPVPWDIGWHAHMTPMEGTTGQVVTRGRIGISYRILVSNPGWYTLTLPEIDGFLPSPPQEVEVLEGQIIDLEISLIRAP